MGSEEFIRLQFEEYLLALLSCMKYHEQLNSFNVGDSGYRSKGELQALNIEGDPALEFNPEFLTYWQSTSNYALFKRLTSDSILFSIVEPRHPCSGGLNIEDIQRRLSQQVAELHLDDRVREGREALNRGLATGQKKVSAAFNSFWSDIETMREAQRKRNEERASQSGRSSMDKGSVNSPPFSPSDSASVPPSANSTPWFGGRKAPSVDIGQAQASVGAVGQRAGAYISAWSSWASEKRKEWQEKKTSPTTSPNVSAPSTPNLGSITEAKDSDRGREQSVRRGSEDSAGLARSMSRRKRWSNIILRRESSDFTSPQRRNENSGECSGNDTPFPRSALSREAPVLVSGDAEEQQADEPVGTQSVPDANGTDDKREEEKPPTETEADIQPPESRPESSTPPAPTDSSEGPPSDSQNKQ